MRLKLARVCVKSYHFEAGIEVLAALDGEHGLAPTLRARVSAALATAFTKKAWFADAETMLLAMLVEARRPMSGVAQLTRTADLSLARLHAMLANVYLRAGRLTKALAAIDVALVVASAHDLGALARLFYVRGKVLQAACRESATLHYPNTLRDDALHAELLAAARSSTSDSATQRSASFAAPVVAVVFRAESDVLQECVETLRGAYRYYKLVGDDVHIAKTVARIAHVYLERVFAPVAFLQRRYADVAHFRRFVPSTVSCLRARVCFCFKYIKNDFFSGLLVECSSWQLSATTQRFAQLNSTHGAVG